MLHMMKPKHLSRADEQEQSGFEMDTTDRVHMLMFAIIAVS